MEARTGQLVGQGLARHGGVSTGLLAFVETLGLGAVALREVRCLDERPGQILVAVAGVNHLTLAVAGSRKTQGLVEHCASLSRERHALVLTYTQANQKELVGRLKQYAGNHHHIEVMGWFTFLLRHFARPFLPFKFAGQRVRGFNFDGRPHRMATGIDRFLDPNGAAYGCELGRLAHELVAESKGALLRRLECIYDEILIDEVQDLSAHDWEISKHSTGTVAIDVDAREARLLADGIDVCGGG
jgi:hypothetical protein